MEQNLRSVREMTEANDMCCTMLHTKNRDRTHFGALTLCVAWPSKYGGMKKNIYG